MNSVAQLQPRGLAMMDERDMRERVNQIQRVMQAVMKDGTHYGKIPGCKQPSLYKAGSEVLLTTFMIGTRVSVEDLSTQDKVRYRVKVTGYALQTGQDIGEGIGECSSGEEKYKWRNAVSQAEYDATPEGRRRIKFGSSYDYNSRTRREYTSMQVRTECDDLANTVLKMAKKRAQIDFTLTAIGASDIFTQDIEDMPDWAVPGEDEVRPQEAAPQQRATSQPQRKSQQQARTVEGEVIPAAKPAAAANEPAASPGQIALIKKKAEQKGLNLDDALKANGLTSLDGISVSAGNALLAWVNSNG